MKPDKIIKTLNEDLQKPIKHNEANKKILNRKQNKGIAIKMINEAVARGEKIVQSVAMSESYYRKKEKAIEKLVSPENKEEIIQLTEPHNNFAVSYNKPEMHAVMEEIIEGNKKIYVIAEDFK